MRWLPEASFDFREDLAATMQSELSSGIYTKRGSREGVERLPQLNNEHGGLFIQMRVAGELKVKEAAFTTARHTRKPDLGWAEDHMQGM